MDTKKDCGFQVNLTNGTSKVADYQSAMQLIDNRRYGCSYFSNFFLLLTSDSAFKAHGNVQRV
jgi:hypothetical protein